LKTCKGCSRRLPDSVTPNSPRLVFSHSDGDLEPSNNSAGNPLIPMRHSSHRTGCRPSRECVQWLLTNRVRGRIHGSQSLHPAAQQDATIVLWSDWGPPLLDTDRPLPPAPQSFSHPHNKTRKHPHCRRMDCHSMLKVQLTLDSRRKQKTRHDGAPRRNHSGQSFVTRTNSEAAILTCHNTCSPRGSQRNHHGRRHNSLPHTNPPHDSLEITHWKGEWHTMDDRVGESRRGEPPAVTSGRNKTIRKRCRTPLPKPLVTNGSARWRNCHWQHHSRGSRI
jgi:hypothetical protein